MTATVTEARPVDAGEAEPLPEDCARRAEHMRLLAVCAVPATVWPDGYTREDIRRVIELRAVWNSHAASHYPRPVFQDGVDIAAFAPELAQHVWHHVAGSTITGIGCCSSPAAHGRALADIARALPHDAPEPIH